jgi:inhibitor of cysteine peptidase
LQETSWNFLEKFSVNRIQISEKELIMLRRILFIFILSGVLAATTGCGPRKIDVNSTDARRQLNVKVGERLAVSLEGNLTTGYTWEASDLDTSMIQQVGAAAFVSSHPGLVGAGGTQTLAFKALKAGTTNLTLIYHRPWEKDITPLHTFTVTINIK